MSISKLNPGKSPGVDNLTIDHLTHAHPVLYTLLSKLFYIMLKYNHVPDEFGVGIIIPIPKDSAKHGKKTHSDYRRITLSPVISKVFENALYFLFSEFLGSSNRQLGFKKNLSCSHAIFTESSTFLQQANLP